MGVSTKSKDEQLIELGLSVRSTFIPQSQSRNAGKKELSLNWKFDILAGERVILSGVEYMQGIGHFPNYQKYIRSTVYNYGVLSMAAEKGIIGADYSYGWQPTKNKLKPPTLSDIVSSLVSDGDALNYQSFEDWAQNYGYDEDSRSAERTYLQCLAIGLKLKNGLGDKLFNQVKELVDANQD